MIVKNADFHIKTNFDQRPASFEFTQNNFELEGLKVSQHAPRPLTAVSYTHLYRGLHVGLALPTVAVDREKEVKIMRQASPAGNHKLESAVVLHTL